MPFQLSILLKTETSRVVYIFRTIFLDILGFDMVEFFTDVEKFREKGGIKLSYDVFDESVPFLARASNILYESGINQDKPFDINTENDLPYFYGHKDSRSILPFDYPAFSFWLLTRYEEYQYFECDVHGRFSAYQSLAYKHNFLELPILDLWAIELRERLLNYYQRTDLPKPQKYSFQPSFDIDYAWAYRNKSLWRTVAAYLKDTIKLDLSAIRERTLVLLGKMSDPYFTFSIIDEIHSTCEKPIFFWLLGNYGKFDKNTHYKNPEFRKLIAEISSKYRNGIHPSYDSNKSKMQTFIEKNRLEEISDTEIVCSRQHFLKLKFPDTYIKLIDIGICHEYSMGYAETPGFRASVSRSYNWYNLYSEQETSLRVHPFMIMDVSLNIYLKLHPETAIAISKKIIDNCKRAGGELIIIWHNNSLCEKKQWRGWTTLYRALVFYATNK